MKALNQFLVSGLALGGFLVATNAAAFCRTTTCNPKKDCATSPEECCVYDSQGCDTNGTPLAWPNSCVSYSVHEEGSDLRGISASDLTDALEFAYDQWLSVSCDGEPLSLAVEYKGLHQCGTREYNDGPDDSNANVWLFRDDIDAEELAKRNQAAVPGDDMTVDPAALAISLVSFNGRTAELYDVDVELYSGLAAFTTADEEIQFDLKSIVTHEAGHFLGLDHSSTFGATMASGYTVGDAQPRTIEDDDRAGICAAYAPGREFADVTCEPRGEYSSSCHESGCDCRSAPARGSAPSLPALFGVFALLGGLTIRRRYAVRAK